MSWIIFLQFQRRIAMQEGVSGCWQSVRGRFIFMMTLMLQIIRLPSEQKNQQQHMHWSISKEMRENKNGKCKH